MKKALFTKKDGAVVDLSKIELNFGELDLETQKALKAWLQYVYHIPCHSRPEGQEGQEKVRDLDGH